MLNATRNWACRNNSQMNSAIDDALGRSGSVAKGWKPGVVPAGSLADVKDPMQRQRLAAFLEATSASEGANYDTIVGGSSFSDYSKHPGKTGLTTADGNSTAAGRYQITGSTFGEVAPKLGIKDFSPELGQDCNRASPSSWCVG